MKPLSLIPMALACLIVGAAGAGMVRDVRADPTGPYEIVAQQNSGNLWVLDSRSGSVRLCHPPLQNKKAPECWPWSDAAQ